MREYSKDVLKQVIVTPPDTHDVHLGEESIITEVEVFIAVKKLKAREAAGCKEIRPELFNALDRVLWLNHVCQVARCTGRVPIG